MRVWPIIDIRGDKNKCLDYLGYGKALLMRMTGWMTSSQVQQCAWRGSPAPGVAVYVEKRMAISRILIDITGGIKKKIIEKMKYYWYHIISNGYRFYINDICVDGAGNIYIIGGHAITGPPRIWFGDYCALVRYTPDGVPVYIKKWTDDPVDTWDYTFGFAITAGEPGFLYALVEYGRLPQLGVYENMLVKLTTAGEIVWDIGLGDTSDWTQVYASNVQHYYEIIADERYDYVYAAGYFKDYAPVSGTTIKMLYLVKTDKNGVVQWKKFVRFAFAASPLWVQCIDIDVDQDGNIYALCFTQDAYTLWLGDFTVMKFNKSGVLQWKKAIDATVHTGDIFVVAHEIVADNYGNVYVLMVEKERTGASTGYMKTVVVNLNPDATLQWTRKYQVPYANNEDPYFDIYFRFAEGRNGDIFVLSQALEDSVAEDDDYILAKFNSTGDNVWLMRMHGLEYDEEGLEDPWGVNIGGMAIDSAGDIVLGGDVYSQDRSFTMKLPDGPINGEFHNFQFDQPAYTITSHAIDIDNEVDLIIEDAADMDIISVDYTTEPLAQGSMTLYKFLESKQTIEVQDGAD